MKAASFAALLATAVAATASAAAAPHIAIRSAAPLVVVGTGFDSHAVVHVAAVLGGRTVKTSSRSSATGSFVARWTARISVSGCTRLTLVAWTRHEHVLIRRPMAKSCGAIWVPVAP